MNNNGIENNKSLINLMVPSIIGGIVFIWAFKNFKGDEKRPLIFAAAAFLISWLLTRTIVNRAIDIESTPDKVQYQGGSAPANNFNPAPLVDSLIQDIYEVWGVRNVKIYDQVVQLNDAELMAVYNAYSKHPGNKAKETLIQAMQDEVYGFTMSAPGLIIDRLKSLGAN